MTPAEMGIKASEAIAEGNSVVLVLPRPWRGRPRNFPKGKLLSEEPRGNVYIFDPKKVLSWLIDNKLIKR